MSGGGVDVFSEGGGAGVLNEDAEEFHGCLEKSSLISCWKLMMNGEVIAENGPAYNISLDSFCMPHGPLTHEGQGSVQIPVVPLLAVLSCFPSSQNHALAAIFLLGWTGNTTPKLDLRLPRS